MNCSRNVIREENRFPSKHRLGHPWTFLRIGCENRIRVVSSCWRWWGSKRDKRLAVKSCTGCKKRGRKAALGDRGDGGCHLHGVAGCARAGGGGGAKLELRQLAGAEPRNGTSSFFPLARRRSSRFWFSAVHSIEDPDQGLGKIKILYLVREFECKKTHG